jgi:dihydroorotase
VTHRDPNQNDNPAQLHITRPDDWHLHLRDDAAMQAVASYSARQFARAIIMPNLKPPVTTVEAALAYRERILAALPADSDFQPLMTLYLTDNTSPEEISKAKQSGLVHAVKYYPAGATTNSDSGVTDLAKTQAVLAEMQAQDVPLLLHGEVTDPEIDIFDREKVFIERHLAPLHERYPRLRMVLEHITTADAVTFVESANDRIAATITPQHILYNRNALLVGGVRPHYYCLPILKREQHRQAVLTAAISGNPKFFLGTDSAPHARSAKETACGCAGIFSAHAALELYASAFEQAGALDKLEGFASQFGADFYGLPRNAGTVTLSKQAWQIPASLDFAEETLVPLLGGEQLAWKLTE